MILSMTGYGQGVASIGKKIIHADLKSLNSKQLDINTHIVPLFREREMDIRAMLKVIERGKVDFTLWIEEESGTNTPHINAASVKSYRDQIDSLSKELGIQPPTDYWPVIVRLPELCANDVPVKLSEDEWQAARKAVLAAIDGLTEFRKQEGAALEKQFREKIANITSLLAQIEPFEKSRTEKIKQQLIDRLNDIPEVNYDKGRLEQEMIYYIEKLDIAEEKQRLTNHLHYFIETLTNGHGQGKKLGFIAQEMGREINTTGSKSNQAEMQNIVVKMKDELEQIKEQVLNVL